MTNLKFHSGARKHLVETGFVPSSSKKVAGLQAEWTHADGRKARVSYGLSGRTGQSSGSGAAWVYFINIDEAGA